MLGFCALVIIIAEGGLTTRWSAVRPVLGAAATLATFGVFVSVAVVGAAGAPAARAAWQLALLYGAVLSSTDAAAVFSTLRRLRIRPRLSATLEAESGINDAPAVLLVIALSALAGPGTSALVAAGAAGRVRAGGRRGDRAGGRVRRRGRAAPVRAAGGRRSTRWPRSASPCWRTPPARSRTRPASWPSTWPGVVLGNARIPHRQAVLGFADGLAWLAQIGLFVLLGLLASPQRLPGGGAAGAGGRAWCWCCWPGRWRWRCQRDLVPGRLARAGVPVLGRAARRGADRAGHHPALARRRRARPGSST